MTPDRNQLAAVAYAAVRNIETVEPNDRERLGYHVYLYLTGTLPSVAIAVSEARSRTTLSDDAVVKIITEQLGSEGVARP